MTPNQSEVLEERLGLGILSTVAAAILPIIAGILLATIKVDVQTPEAGFTGYAIGSVGLFLILIFIVPVTTLFSIVSAVVTYKHSQTIGRWVAITSGVVTAAGIVLVILLIQKLQSSGA